MNKYNFLSKSLILCTAIFLIAGCIKNDDIEKRSYQITWQDEFEGPQGQSPDASKWVYDLGRGDNGWGNQELESYTNLPENVSLDGNGNLAITALKTGGFTSARIKTQGVFDQTYGRFEARIKLPWGPGIWPAFWLLGSDVETNPWPQCGEIDIMEYRGQEPNLIHGTVHGPGYSGGAGVTKSFGFQNNRFDVDFHIFAIEWTEDYIDYYVDDVLFSRIEQKDVSGEWVYDHPFFIILNVAVGGTYVGFPTDETNFPQTMLIDWVRVSEEVQ